MSLPKEMEYVDQTRLDSILGAALSVIRAEILYGPFRGLIPSYADYTPRAVS